MAAAAPVAIQGGTKTGARVRNPISDRERAWAALIAVGVVAYIAVDALLLRLEPGYSLIHNAESDYAVGPYGWLMGINFLLRGGVGVIAGTQLWWRLRGSTGGWVGAALLTMWGVASGLLALFPDDPPGHPATAAGEIHLQLALVAFLAVAAGTILVSLQLRRDPVLGAISLPLLLLAVIAIVPLLLLGHTRLGPHSPYGLYERLFLGLEQIWSLVVGLRLLAAPRPKSLAEPTSA